MGAGVHKLRLQEEGGRWSKKSTFCKLLYHRKCKQRGVGGQKKPNFVNIVCERPLTVHSGSKIKQGRYRNCPLFISPRILSKHVITP